MRVVGYLMVAAAVASLPAAAREGHAWATSWAASVQGAYPVGNPSALPDQRFAFPEPAAPTTKPFG